MQNLKYKALLTNPLWIKKRSRIFYRDKHQCTACGSKKHIEVHHTFYYADYPPPWQYPNWSLITLCSVCHKEYHSHFDIQIKKRKKLQRDRNKRKKSRSNHNKKLKQAINSYSWFLNKFKK